MKKYLTNKITLFLILLVTLLFLLPQFSLAQSENIQMIKKSSNEYLIYVDGLLNESFEFAFANNAQTEKENLVFQKSALDKTENGNNIAYIDSELYTNYFNEKEETFLWVKVGEEYKLEAEKVELNNALSEVEIQYINQTTKTIKVEVGEKELPTEKIDGVNVKHKIGTLKITESENNTYSYIMMKSTEGSEVENLIQLANELNNLQDKNIYEQLSVYQQFKNAYIELQPELKSKNWAEVKEATIEQPQNSKKGEQYLVWIKQNIENGAIMDIQIMTCQDEYIPEYEKQEIVIKETSKMPVTGENLTLYVIAGIVLVLIAIVLVLKFKNKKTAKHS